MVIATYNRRASLLRLLSALADQTLRAERFEVVVVDDGSADGTAPALAALELPYALRVIQQANAGAAAARQAGVRASTGAVLLFLDDDMLPCAELLAEHLKFHTDDPRAVVLGHITAPPPEVPRPPFVRYGERMLARDYARIRSGALQPGARHCYGGNLSTSRALFWDAGGFDVSMRRNEDVELAYRMAERGAHFHFCARAETTHYCDHASFAAWRETAYADGVARVRTFQKLEQPPRLHPILDYHSRHPLNRFLILVSIGSDRTRRPLSAVLRIGGVVLAAAGLGHLAWYAYSAIHSINYFAGMRDAVGGVRAFSRQLGRQSATAPPP